MERFMASRGARADDRLVIIHPWTSNPKKQWPRERFIELIRRAQQAGRNIRIAVIGDAKAREAMSAFLAGLPPSDVLDAVGCLTLRQLAGLLRLARCVVSSDSGPVHVAAAVGTPVVALFGATDPATGPGRWGPWGDGHTVIAKASMEDIQVDDVLQAVNRYLCAPQRETFKETGSHKSHVTGHK